MTVLVALDEHFSQFRGNPTGNDLSGSNVGDDGNDACRGQFQVLAYSRQRAACLAASLTNNVGNNSDSSVALGNRAADTFTEAHSATAPTVVLVAEYRC